MNWLERSRLLLSRLPIKHIASHKMVGFNFNPNQSRRFDMINEQWKREGIIRIIDLKSRRAGVSSQTDGLIWCYNLAFPNMNSKIVAHLAISAEELFRVPSDLSKAFPSFASEDILMKRINFPHKGGQSVITLATAGTPAAGRGGTLSALHLCLRGDALVFSDHGNLVPIADLRNGDKVWTHRATPSRVRLVSSRPAEDVSPGGDCLEIRCWMNHERLVITPEHKVWTSRGWQEGKDITTRDEIGTPIRPITGRTTRIRTRPMRDSWGRKKRGRDEFFLDLDGHFGFFCGYYLAEGHIHGAKPQYPCGVHFAHHQDETAFAMQAVYGVRTVISSHSTKKLNGKRATTAVYSAALARWVAENFGLKDEKRIPDWVFDAPESFVAGLVDGYLAGDGSKGIANKRNYECPTIYATSVRPRLLYQLRHLLASLGWGWGGITFEKGGKDHRDWNNRPSWTLSISGHPALKVRKRLGLAVPADGDAPSSRRSSACKYRLEHGYVWTRVKSIGKAKAETVWDIEVDHADHSFETVIGAVANSEAAYYPSDDSFTSMISSVSKGPGSIIVIESTAQGREGPGEAFFEYWTNAVEGRNGYIPCFLGWLSDPLCWRPEEEAEDAPVDDLEKELMGPRFKATRAQIAWMRRTKADDCRDIETKWLTDYPHCPEVAFQVSGEPAFARDELAYAQTTVHDPLAQGRFVRTTGGGVKFERKAEGPVLIWKFPYDDKGKSDAFKYYIGGDSAAGTQAGDFASWVSLCGQTGELAARFAARVDPEVFADQLDMAGRWYNHAIVNPELTGGLGRWTLIKLRDTFRYPNIYIWKGRDDRKRGKGKSLGLGFEMNQATRRLIIDAARSGLRMAMRGEPGGLIVNDRVLMSQIDLCTLKEWRWQVEYEHDDVLVAWMIATLTREQYPPARMSFAPKNILDEQDNKSKIDGLKLQPTELHQIFFREMARIRRAAGLNAQMRGIGRRHIDRLRGI